MSTPQIKRSDSHGSVHSNSSDGSTFVDKMGVERPKKHGR